MIILVIGSLAYKFCISDLFYTLHFYLIRHAYVCFIFCEIEIKEKLDSSHKRDIEGMGVPEIKHGDSVCFVQHIASGLWVTYKAQDAKTSRLGPLEKKGGVRKG